MVGSAIHRRLLELGFQNIITKTREQLDLCHQQAVLDFFSQEQPQYVFLAAAKVGGILANDTYRADFLYENLMIESNIIHAAHVHNTQKLLFLGSSCIYPKMAAQPIQEESLLTGLLEPTNEPYAIAKIAGIKLCEAYYDQYQHCFISAMPTNLYGPNDNYHPQNSHVLPALIRKFHEAKLDALPSVTIWGDGSPLREFMHVDDLADASIYLMQHYSDKAFVNIGSSSEISIRDLALLVQDIVGYSGSLHFDTSKPNGTPRKLMDSSKLHALGWQPRIPLTEGIRSVYELVRDTL